MLPAGLRRMDVNCFLASFYGVIGFGAQLVWVQCISAGALMLVLTDESKNICLIFTVNVVHSVKA